jgi:hypothetical protein
MNQYKLNERKWVIGPCTIRKAANGETRIDGRYLVLQRSTSGRWAICAPTDNMATVKADAEGRDYHATRKAAMFAAINLLAPWATE